MFEIILGRTKAEVIVPYRAVAAVNRHRDSRIGLIGPGDGPIEHIAIASQLDYSLEAEIRHPCRTIQWICRDRSGLPHAQRASPFLDTGAV